MDLLQIFKDTFPTIDGRKTISWRYIDHEDGTVSIRCENSTRDFIPCPDINLPDGYELLSNVCLEDDERYTRWEWKLRIN